MEKLQSGLVIEFYSNSCLVRTANEDIKCLAIKNIVVGDIVNLELVQDSKETRGIIVSKETRTSFLQKREGIKSKAVAANISHVGILVTPEPSTSSEFIDKWLVTASSSNIAPFIINNKTDLDQSPDYKEKLQIYKDLDIKIINLSAIFHSWFEIFKKQLGHKKSPLHLAYGLLGKLNSVRYTSRPWGVSSRASKFVFIEILYHNFGKTSSLMKAAFIRVFCRRADNAGRFTFETAPCIEGVAA